MLKITEKLSFFMKTSRRKKLRRVTFFDHMTP